MKAREAVAYRDANPGTTSSNVRVIRLAEVSPLPVRWLWGGRIPLGMLTVLDGDPGSGKSTLLLDLAARLSRGDAMPDGSPGPGVSGAVVLSAEDDLARVIRPRLDVAGGDLERIVTVHLTDEGESRDPTICAEDLKAVEEAVRRVGARLVIVDPLVAFLPADVNAHRDQDVRRALADLRALAERTDAAVIVVRHLNKSDSVNALYRGGGSIGIIGAARAGLLVARDPGDAERRILAPIKANLARLAASWAFRLESSPGADHPRVVWEGPSEHAAASLLIVPEDDEEARERAEERKREVEVREARLERAAMALREAVASCAASGEPMMKDRDAVPFLRRLDLGQGEARRLVKDGVGWDWRIERTGGRGNPETLVPIHPPDPRITETGEEEVKPRQERVQQASISVGRVDNGHGNGRDAEPALDAGGSAVESFPLSVGETEEKAGGDGPAPCSECGGLVIVWSFGAVCTRCHARVPSSGDESSGAALASPEPFWLWRQDRGEDLEVRHG